MLYAKLRGALREREIDQEYLAQKLNFNQITSISKRLTGKTDWKMSEAYAVLDLIGAPPDKLVDYFPKGGIRTN
jgi:hypothetical protein